MAVAIAIPSTLVQENKVYSLEQATYALYQIAKACCHFKVTEIIVYESVPEQAAESKPKKIKLDESQPNQINVDDNLVLMANILQYLITPKYLRRMLFKKTHKSAFKNAKKLPKLLELKDNTDVVVGVAVPEKKLRKQHLKLTKGERKRSSKTQYVNVGFNKLLKLKNDQLVPVNSQVALNLKTNMVEPKLVGYTIRAVNDFSAIFTQSPLPNGYQQTIFIPCQQFYGNVNECQSVNLKDDALLIFGSQKEVDLAVSKDSNLDVKAADLFDGVLNSFERTRVEDAVAFALAKLI